MQATLPEQRAVEVWGPADAEPLPIEAAERMDAAPLYPGLTIELAEIWAG